MLMLGKILLFLLNSHAIISTSINSLKTRFNALSDNVSNCKDSAFQSTLLLDSTAHNVQDVIEDWHVKLNDKAVAKVLDSSNVTPNILNKATTNCKDSDFHSTLLVLYIYIYICLLFSRFVFFFFGEWQVIFKLTFLCASVLSSCWMGCAGSLVGFWLGFLILFLEVSDFSCFFISVLVGFVFLVWLSSDWILVTLGVIVFLWCFFFFGFISYLFRSIDVDLGGFLQFDFVLLCSFFGFLLFRALLSFGADVFSWPPVPFFLVCLEFSLLSLGFSFRFSCFSGCFLSLRGFWFGCISLILFVLFYDFWLSWFWWLSKL